MGSRILSIYSDILGLVSYTPPAFIPPFERFDFIHVEARIATIVLLAPDNGRNTWTRTGKSNGKPRSHRYKDIS